MSKNTIKPEQKKESVTVIDLTPKWEDLAGFIAEGASNGNSVCNGELLRMAKLADSRNEIAKFYSDFMADPSTMTDDEFMAGMGKLLAVKI